MGDNTKIQWCDATFNPWRGCAKVSPGCANCYAEKQAMRNPKVLGIWGVDGTRPVASESMWRQPLKWNAEAREENIRRRVFCASMADVFEEREDLDPVRLRLFAIIASTPDLDWLLLTKRPHAIMSTISRIERSLEGATTAFAFALDGSSVRAMLRDWLGGNPPANVWLGTSAEDQQRWSERVPHLMRAPAVVHFVSVEPQIGGIEIMKTGRDTPEWIIVGGESGPKARPFHLEWASLIVKDAHLLGIPVFVKQMGENAVRMGEPFKTEDRKGGDPDGWPLGIRVREFPSVGSLGDD